MASLPYLRALTIGAVAGLRSMTAPAAALFARDNQFAGLALLAAGAEMIADKLPATPARTALPIVAFRALSGALCGGAVAARLNGSRILGMAAGAAGAVGATYAAFSVRRYAAQNRGLPDFPVALVEDAIAVWAARAATAPAS